MSDTDKLQEYIRDNTPKKTKTKSTPPPPIPKKDQPRTALSWYTRKIVGDIIGFTFIATVLGFLSYLYLNSNMGWEEEPATQVALIIWFSLMALNVGAQLYRLSRYRTWVRGGYYKLRGWDDFFRKRSELYWVQRRYTNIKVIIKLTPDATPIHLDAAKAFVKQRIVKWKKRYEGIEWEPGYGKPKDLVGNGTTIQGDISLAEVMELVKILVGRFLPLSKLLGDKLAEVVIESNEAEDLIKTKKVSRMDR